VNRNEGAKGLRSQRTLWLESCYIIPIIVVLVLINIVYNYHKWPAITVVTFWQPAIVWILFRPTYSWYGG